jgi:hypothetical protein
MAPRMHERKRPGWHLEYEIYRCTRYRERARVYVSNCGPTQKFAQSVADRSYIAFLEAVAKLDTRHERIARIAVGGSHEVVERVATIPLGHIHRGVVHAIGWQHAGDLCHNITRAHVVHRQWVVRYNHHTSVHKTARAGSEARRNNGQGHKQGETIRRE